MPGPVVISISSHVARGSVGNRAMAFALERLGFTVWTVPTLILPHHPGHGAAERIVPDESAFAGILRTLVEGPRSAAVAGIISGYFASAAQAKAVAGLVQAVKAARPGAIYLCDPVIGDDGRRYVGELLAQTIRDELLPLADAATPNAFECAWLSGHAGPDMPDLAELARGLPPPMVLVTSAPALMRGKIGNLLVETDSVHLIEHPKVATAIKGTGDLLASLLLARRIEGQSWPEAAQMAVSSTYEIVAGSAGAGADELMLAEFQQAVVQPRVSIAIRRIAS